MRWLRGTVELSDLFKSTAIRTNLSQPHEREPTSNRARVRHLEEDAPLNGDINLRTLHDERQALGHINADDIHIQLSTGLREHLLVQRPHSHDVVSLQHRLARILGHARKSIISAGIRFAPLRAAAVDR